MTPHSAEPNEPNEPTLPSERPYDRIIAEALKVRPAQVAAAISLLDGGNTLPFIARYRKEMTGSLDEDQLRTLGDLLERLRTLDKRREVVLASIAEQGKLTEALRAQIAAAATLTDLEDLYQPFRPRRTTRAMIAREQGLEPLAQMILEQVRTRQTLDEIAAPFITGEVPTTEAALAGACDIAAEVISDHPGVRREVRQRALKWGVARARKTKGADDPKAVYQTYYDFEVRVDRLQPHQILALNRGEAEKVLRVSLDIAERDWLGVIQREFRVQRASPLAVMLEAAIQDGAQRLLLPAIERDVRRALTEKAEAHAIQVFAANLRGLLHQPPLSGHTILGMDPGFRTGCKLAVIDPTGKVIATGTIYPHEPQRQWEAALQEVSRLILRHRITLIAIGNGTASRETEQFAAELVRKQGDLRYLLVNEAGASVYSASPLARAELPALDVSLRGAVSIARRVQDPLAELVKIDPKAIGVGLYQHDVDQKQLAATLDGVVESVVNHVGVDVNTASPALLTHVAGIGPKLAERIVAFRDAHGTFASRQALKQVPGLGPKAFEQAAGFLRVRGGDNPLDASAIHPESYPIAQAVLTRTRLTLTAAPTEREAVLKPLKAQVEPMAAELGTGAPTLADILEQLVRPGRDPREDLPAPILRSDVLSMADLLPGMRLNGTVRNVVDFGLFVDIGVKQDGLLHRTQLPRNQMLKVGDVIVVEVLNVEEDRGRISLGWVGDAPG